MASLEPAHDVDAATLADDIRCGRRTATETLDHFAARIGEYNELLNAFVFLDLERAREQARAVDSEIAKGEDPGPLAGVPLGIKELEPVDGWPLTWASRVFMDNVASHTSTQVARAVEAGAIPVGLTSSPEFGRASFTSSSLHGVTRNPWRTDTTPGGSSGGSAAVTAAGLVPLATGSDGAGSLRIPASFSNLVGFKGTYGRIPLGPGFIDSSNRGNRGVLTRSVGDTLRFLDCVVGADERDPTSLPHPGYRYEDKISSVGFKGCRIVWSPELGFAPCDPRVAECCREAAEVLIKELGAREPEFDINLPDCSEAFRTLSVPGTYRVLDGIASENHNLLSPTVRQYLEPAETFDIDMLVSAHEARSELVATLAFTFANTDLILTPTTQTLPFAADGPMPTEIDGRRVSHQSSIGLTFPFNLSGHPAVSVPAGTVDGLPVGLQIIGRHHDDLRILAAAAVLERSRPWPRLAPFPNSSSNVRRLH